MRQLGLRLPLEGDRRLVRRRALSHAVFGLVPVLLTLDVMYDFHRGHIIALDFHHEYWVGAWRVLHGLSPYARHWMHISGSISFPYPAFTAMAFVPLALLPHGLADWIFTGTSIAAALLTLRVLEVRDWRLYGLTLMFWPVVVGWQTANLTLVLGLGVACLWRKRDEPAVAGLLLAAMISLKPTFVWPLAVWLLASRRYRALAYAAASGVAVNLVAWAIVGFSQIHAYLAVDSAVNNYFDRRGYGIVSIILHLGGSRPLAYALGYAAAAPVAIACFRAARRGHDRASMTLCIATCLLATPILWTHYFAFLIIPLGLYRPRLDRLWLVLLPMIVCPATGPVLSQVVVAWVASTIVLVGLLVERTPRTSIEPAGVAPRGNELAVQFES